MPSKLIDLPEIGPVTFIKSARSRSIRLSVTSRGVRVSLPHWTPYAAATLFAKQHTAWIQAEQAKQSSVLLQDGDKIGKLHTLVFMQVPERSETRCRVTPTKLLVQLHPSENISSSAVQERATKAALRALKKEAATVLPSRVQKIAMTHGLALGTVRVKNLKRRWGSCDSRKNITLNIFLMQLSWQQIDYVICHELAHTKHMNHSVSFLNEVERMLPDARMIAKRVRHIQPALIPQLSSKPVDD